MARAKRRERDFESREIPELLDQFEEELERLKVLYDKYFIGIDKVPPVKERDRVDRMLNHMLGLRPNNSVLRFRLHGLKARLVTYKHYWTRVLKQIEAGTYHRDQRRMARKRAEAERKAQEAKQTDAKRKEIARRAQETSVAKLPDGVSSREARDLFKALVHAKKAAGESTDGLTYGALVRKLAREAPKIKEKHGVDSVRFEVSTAGGKVKLRARKT